MSHRLTYKVNKGIFSTVDQMTLVYVKLKKKSNQAREADEKRRASTASPLAYSTGRLATDPSSSSLEGTKHNTKHM